MKCNIHNKDAKKIKTKTQTKKRNIELVNLSSTSMLRRAVFVYVIDDSFGMICFVNMSIVMAFDVHIFNFIFGMICYSFLVLISIDPKSFDRASVIKIIRGMCHCLTNARHQWNRNQSRVNNVSTILEYLIVCQNLFCVSCPVHSPLFRELEMQLRYSFLAILWSHWIHEKYWSQLLTNN